MAKDEAATTAAGLGGDEAGGKQHLKDELARLKN
jgi:hypothetical protein